MDGNKPLRFRFFSRKKQTRPFVVVIAETNQALTFSNILAFNQTAPAPLIESTPKVIRATFV